MPQRVLLVLPWTMADNTAMASSNSSVFDPIVPLLRQQWKRFGVRKAWVFGSRASLSTTPESDWDFLVDFALPPGFDNFMGLKNELEACLGARVDLCSLGGPANRGLSRRFTTT